MAAKIRKGDKVVVLSGRDKGRTGEVFEVRPDDNKALVRGVNLVKRHQQQTQAQAGGSISTESPIHLSNIAIVGKDGKPTRVGFKIHADGKKVRVAKRSGAEIDG
jgi:large subunit ribosomal protein L24